MVSQAVTPTSSNRAIHISAVKADTVGRHPRIPMRRTRHHRLATPTTARLPATRTRSSYLRRPVGSNRIRPPPWQQPPAAPRSSSSNAGAVLVGIFLVLVGVWFLFRDEIALDFGQLWPAAAVGLGAVMVVAAFIPRRRR